MARGSADFRSIYEKVLLSPRFQNAAFLRAKLKYSQAKKVFFDEFNKHPVTKEISGGDANLTRANGLVPIPAVTFNQG